MTLAAVMRLYADRINVVTSPDEYRVLVEEHLPVLLEALEKTPPSLHDDKKHQTRHDVLLLLNRLPITELLHPHVDTMAKLVIAAVVQDNEPNAIICIRILFELHKNFPQQVQHTIPHFVQFVASLFTNLGQALHTVFEAGRQERFRRSTDSFRVLARCPLLVSLLFQLNPQYLHQLLPSLIHPMILALQLPVSSSLALSHPSEFVDFVDVQVKILSFLNSVLRTDLANRLQVHASDIAQAAVQLLLMCPREGLQCRKELLMTLRMLFKTEIRSAFYRHFDALMDERTLVGPDCPAPEIYRPLAFTALAELVKYMCGEFSVPQLQRLVQLLCRNVQDSTLPLSIQTVSAKRLIELVDNIFKAKESPAKSRFLLVRILNCFVDKCESLQEAIPALVTATQEQTQCQGWEWTMAYESSDVFPMVRAVGVQQLLSIIVQGLKPIVWCVAKNHDGRFALQPQETMVVMRFYVAFLGVLELYAGIPQLATRPSSRYEDVSGGALKELIEQFADVFCVLDTASFRRVFSRHLPLLFDAMLRYESFPLIVIPRHFLGSANITKTFGDTLLLFLIDVLERRTHRPDDPESKLVLVLFAALLGSLTLFADNEAVLRPYLRRILEHLMERLANEADPTFYLQTLRQLFRGISGGRFEALYHEMLQMLDRLLRTLLETSMHAPSNAALAIELCLTVPARLSSLLPVMPLMVQSVEKALRSPNDQVVRLGLRTLDFWVGKVKHEFLYLQMTPHLVDIMTALCDLLHNPAFGTTAARILGKLGGRNRKFLLEAQPVSLRQHADAPILDGIHLGDAVTAVISNVSSTPEQPSSQRFLVAACDVLLSQPSSPTSNALLHDCLRGIAMCPMPAPDAARLPRLLASSPADRQRAFATALLAALLSPSSSALALLDQFIAAGGDQLLVLRAAQEACYAPNVQQRRAAVRVMEKVDAPVSAVCDSMRALMHCYTDQVSYEAQETMASADALLEALVVQHCEANAPVNDVVLILCPELISAVEAVRDCAHRLAQRLCALVSTSYAALLEPYHERLLHPVLSHSLDNFPTSTRIGFLSITSRCMLLEPPLVKPSDELVQLLQETVGYLLSDDRASSRKLQTQAICLRIESLKLVSAALVSPLHASLEHQGLRQRITLALFRSLMHPNARVVEAAKEGLLLVTSKESLPKDLLQECLRPILMNLSDARRLNDHLLKLLEQLLELLSSCFNATLGEKLLDHLFYFSEALKSVAVDPQVPKSKPHDVASWHEVRIPTAIIDLFHLLPPAPRQFLTKLVMNVVNLELIIPRVRTYGEKCIGASSPFRRPLIKFLNKYAAEAVAFFLTPKNLVDRTLSHLFLAVLESDEGGQVRETLKYIHDQMIAATFNIEQSQQTQKEARRPIPSKAVDELQLQGVQLVHTLAKGDEQWLLQCHNVIRCLLSCWRDHGSSTSTERELELEYEHVKKWRAIAECIMMYTKEHLDSAGFVWTLMYAFKHRTLVDYSFLADFGTKYVAYQSTIAEKKTILTDFFSTVLFSPRVFSGVKVKCLQLIVLPIMEAAREQGVVEQVMEAALLKETLMQSQTVSELPHDVRVELLRFFAVSWHELQTALPVSEFVALARHEVESLQRVSLDADITLYTASLVQKTHILAYQLLADLAPTCSLVTNAELASAFARLLHCHAIDFSDTVQTTMDALFVVLVETRSQPDLVMPAIKSTLRDCTHTLPQMVHIWSLMVRQQRLFQPYCEPFVSHIAASLNRLGIPERPVLNRKLSIDIVDTLLVWSSMGASIPITVIDMASNFIVRLALMTCDSRDVIRLAQRCLDLLPRLLAVWPSARLTLGFLERVLQSTPAHPTSAHQTALDAARIILEHAVATDTVDTLLEESSLLAFIEALLQAPVLPDRFDALVAIATAHCSPSDLAAICTCSRDRAPRVYVAMIEAQPALGSPEAVTAFLRGPHEDESRMRALFWLLDKTPLHQDVVDVVLLIVEGAKLDENQVQELIGKVDTWTSFSMQLQVLEAVYKAHKHPQALACLVRHLTIDNLGQCSDLALEALRRGGPLRSDVRRILTHLQVSAALALASHPSLLNEALLALDPPSGILEHLRDCQHDTPALAEPLARSLLVRVSKTLDLVPLVLPQLLELTIRADTCRLLLAVAIEAELRLPSAVLVQCARSKGCWYEAVELLTRQDALAELAEVFACICEDDLRMAALCRIASPDLVEGLDQAQFGRFTQAQSKLAALDDPLAEGAWVHCTKELNQWSSLTTYAAETRQSSLMAACADTLGDWELLRGLVEQATGLDRLVYQVHLDTERVAKVEGNPLDPLQTLRTRCETATQSALDQWKTLPRRASGAHEQVLGSFQQLIEMHETVDMLTVSFKTMLNQARPPHAQSVPPDLKQVLMIWRDRVPNRWEPLTAWNSILSWRLHAFAMMSQLVHAWSPSLALRANIQDTAWTVTAFASVAREHSLPDAASAALHTLAPLDLVKRDAFSLAREKVLLCLERDPTAAVQLVNAQDVEGLSGDHKAELFCLKGRALQRLGRADEAHHAFSSGLAVCDEYGQGWLRWGQLCDQMHAEHNERQWAEFALTCYLQAVRFDTSYEIRFRVPRILWLLNADTLPVLERYVDDIPLWVWLLWIPQLLSSLARPEGAVLKTVLEKVAVMYPQALYYSVRAYFHEKKEAFRAPDQGEASLSLVTSIVGALKGSHPALVSELEKVLEELGKRFKPRPEEELMGAVYALFLRCFKHPGTDVTQQLQETIDRVCRKFFEFDDEALRSKKLQQFADAFQKPFIHDFRTDFPTSMDALIDRLQRWKARLRDTLRSRPSSLPLERVSPFLMRFQGYGVEMPGQYVKDEEPRVNMNVMLEYFIPQVDVLPNHGFGHRCVRVRGSNGREQAFAIQYSVSHITKADERFAQLFLVWNRTMAATPQSRMRKLAFRVPTIVPVTNRLRLMLHHPDTASMEHLYEQGCARAGIDPDAPLLQMRSLLQERDALCALDDSTDAAHTAAVAAARVACLKEVCSPAVAGLLLQQIEARTATHEDLWAIRIEAGRQAALSGLMAYLFRIGDRSLHKQLFSQASGHIQNAEFYPSYSSKHRIELNEAVPFRLGINMQTLLTPVVMDGVVVASLVSAAASLMQHQELMLHLFHVSLRDDMVSWVATRSPAVLGSDAKQREVEEKLRSHIEANAQDVLARAQSILPPPGAAEQGVASRARQLVHAASDWTNLAQMSPTWHPWF